MGNHLPKDNGRNYFTHNVNIFPKSIILKVNTITRLEFEYHFDITAQLVNQYATWTVLPKRDVLTIIGSTHWSSYKSLPISTDLQ